MTMSGTSQLPADAQLYVRYHERQPQLGGSLEAFSETLREVYNGSVAESMRRVQLSSDVNVVTRFETNGKRLRRYNDECSKHLFPLILMPAFVNAAHQLDPLAGVAMRTDICRAVGSLYVPMPEPTAVPDLAHVSRLAKEFGESVAAMAPIVEGQRVDRASVANALQQLDELMGAAMALKVQLGHVAAGEGAAGALR